MDPRRGRDLSGAGSGAGWGGDGTRARMWGQDTEGELRSWPEAGGAELRLAVWMEAGLELVGPGRARGLRQG